MGDGKSGKVVEDKGNMVLTFQLHICQPDCRAETMSVETDLTAVRGSCSRDRPLWPSSTLAPSVILAKAQGLATLGNTSVLETLASLRGSTNFKVSVMMEALSTFNAFFLQSGFSKMVNLVLCFQNTT